MKKYFIFGSAIILTSCSYSPSCSDDIVVRKVIEINTLQRQTQITDLRRRTYNDIYPDNPLVGIESTFDNEKDHEELKKIENYKKISTYISDYLDENYENIPKNIYPAIEKNCANVGEIFKPEVKNIRATEKDDELKSCGCNADLEYPTDKIYNKSIYYTAQQTSDGQTYVEVYKVNN